MVRIVEDHVTALTCKMPQTCFNVSSNVSYLVVLQYPVPDGHILKSSRIGKAVMLLFRHPKETRKNKEKAGKIISEYPTYNYV